MKPMGEKDFALVFSGLKHVNSSGAVWGKFSLTINGKKIVFRPHENKKYFFYFDFPQTILAIKHFLKFLQQIENFEHAVVVDFSGEEDAHSIKIKVNHFNSNLRLEIFEIFEGEQYFLFEPVMASKAEFSKKLKSFLKELNTVLKEKRLFEMVEKEVKNREKLLKFSKVA